MLKMTNEEYELTMVRTVTIVSPIGPVQYVQTWDTMVGALRAYGTVGAWFGPGSVRAENVGARLKLAGY